MTPEQFGQLGRTARGAGTFGMAGLGATPNVTLPDVASLASEMPSAYTGGLTRAAFPPASQGFTKFAGVSTSSFGSSGLPRRMVAPDSGIAAAASPSAAFAATGLEGAFASGSFAHGTAVSALASSLAGAGLASLGRVRGSFDLGAGNRRALRLASADLAPSRQSRIVKGIRSWAQASQGFSTEHVALHRVGQAAIGSDVIRHILAFQTGRSNAPGSVRRARLWFRKWARVGLAAFLRGTGSDPATAILRPPPLRFTPDPLPEGSDLALRQLLEQLADVIMPNAPSGLARNPLFGDGSVARII